MSTLVAQTISNGTVSTSSANVIQGSAKAWVRFTGTTINASYNVSSITNPSTGRYVVNLTNAVQDTNYSAFIGTNNSATNPGGNNIFDTNAGSITTTAFPFSHYEGNNTLYNPVTATVVIFR
jgi:hypothetical protein